MAQNNWRWCHKCQGLFFAGGPTYGVCAAGGTHDLAGSSNYNLDDNIGSSLQENWRWCNQCQGLFFAGNPTSGACSAGGGHNYSGSSNYSLTII